MRAYRVFLIILGVSAFASACAYTLNLVYQIQIAHLDPLQLVIVGTVLEVTCLVAQVPTGVIADLHSRRLSVIIGVLLTGAGTMLQGLVPSFLAIAAGSVLWGIGATCVDGALEAWAADEIGEDRVGHVFARGAQVWQGATVLGIGAAIALASVRLDLPVIVGAAVWLALGVALIGVMPEHSFVRPERTGPLRQLGDGVRAVRSRPVVLFLFAAAGFLALGGEGFDRLSQAHFLADLAFPALATPVVWLGVFSVVAMLGSIGLTEVVRRRTESLQPGRVGIVLVAFHASGVVSMLVFALAGQFWVAAGAWLLAALLRSSAGPLYGAWLVAHTESATRATVISASGMVDAAGQITGGPPVGLIGQRGSIRLALVATALLTAPAVAFFAVALARQRRTPTISA